MNQETFRLLVVDDEETTRQSLAEILQLDGYLVDTANGGDTAIKMISHQTYDLILLDLKMPGVDGLDVLFHLDQQYPTSGPEKTSQLPPKVIMLTANGSLESAIEALRHGAHDYLLKPSSPAQILQSIAQALNSRTAQIKQQTRLLQLEKTKSSSDGENPESMSSGYQNLYRLPNNISYDSARREIIYQSIKILLTPTEGKLMKVLLDNPGHVFNHRELVLLVQGYETKEWEAPEVLRPLVSRLRRKLVRLPEGDKWIVSIRGTGYVIDIGSST